MKILTAILGLLISFVLMIVSLPWLFLSIGAGFWGDEESYDRWLDSSPVFRFMEWRYDRSS